MDVFSLQAFVLSANLSKLWKRFTAEIMDLGRKSAGHNRHLLDQSPHVQTGMSGSTQVRPSCGGRLSRCGDSRAPAAVPSGNQAGWSKDMLTKTPSGVPFQ